MGLRPRRRALVRLLSLGVALLLVPVASCRPQAASPAPATVIPSPVLALRAESDRYLAGEGEIRLIVDNPTDQAVYLPMCGPWTVYRLAGPNRLEVWKMQCGEDFLAFELPAGQSVAGVLTLSDPAAAPYYLAATAGSYQAEARVFRDCGVGEPVGVQTGLKYGELSDCERQELLVSAVFQVEGERMSPVARVTPEETAPVALGLRLVAQVGGAVEAVAWRDGLVAAGVGPRLVLYSRVVRPGSQVADLVPLGHTGPLPGLVRDVALQDGRAYLALGASGLLVVDVQVPEAPKVAGAFQPGGYVQDVDVAEAMVAVAADTAGFWILDVGDPGNPTVLNHPESASPAEAVDLYQGNAYLLAGDWLEVLDMTNAAAPEVRSMVQLSGPGRRLLVDDQRAYVAAEQDGVLVIDLTDLAAPTELAPVASLKSVKELAMWNDTLLAADHLAGVALIDGKTLSITGGFDTPGAAMGLAVQDGTLLVADYSAGIRQVALDGATGLHEESPPWLTLGWVSGVAADGGLVATAGTAGLGLVEMTHLAELPAIQFQLAEQADSRQSSIDVALQGGRAFVVQPEVGLRVFEVAEPFAEIGRYAVDRARAVAVQGQIAFLVHADGLAVLDVSQMPPRVLQTLTQLWDAADALATETALYVADRAGNVWALNVANPTRPVIANRWERPALGLAMGDHILVAAVGSRGLRTAAIAEPTRPIEMGRWLTEDARAVVVVGPIAYLADARSGVHVIGLQNPAEPAEVGVLQTPGSPQAIASDGERILVADAAGGLLVYQRQ